MFKIRKNIPLYLIFLIGIICALVMLMGRTAAEGANRVVACAISYDDILSLSKESGQAPKEWVKPLKEAGLSYLILTDKNQEEALLFANALGLQYGRSGDRAMEGDSFLMPHVEQGNLRVYDAPKGERSVPLILVEDLARTGVVMPEGMDLQGIEQPLVKGFYLYEEYSDSYQQGDAPCEPENILFRATFERGMRLLILSPLVGDGGVEADPAVYAGMLRSLSARIEARGLSFGALSSIPEVPAPVPLLLAGALLLLPAVLVLLMKLLIKTSALMELCILLGTSAAVLFFAVLAPLEAQKIGALIGMILLGCLFSVLLAREAEGRSIFENVESPWLRCLCLLLAALTVGISGGLYIGGLLGTERYLLGISVFYGVKISQLIPIAFTALLLMSVFIKQKEYRSLLENKKSLFLKLALAVLGFAIMMGILLLRSGDATFAVADMEEQFRNWMEQTLFARPRTKEFLIAFPSLGIFVFACRKNAPLLKLFFGCVAGIGCVSVLNTFCHIVTPVEVSLLRTFISAGLGLLFAWLALGLFMLLFSKKRKGE